MESKLIRRTGLHSVGKLRRDAKARTFQASICTSTFSQLAAVSSARLIPVVLLEMTVIGPANVRLPEHEHPEVQITMNFVAPPLPGKGKAMKDDPSHFSLYPSGMAHGGKESDGAELLVTVFAPADIEKASDELLRRSSSELVSAPCAVEWSCGGLRMICDLGYWVVSGVRV